MIKTKLKLAIAFIFLVVSINAVSAYCPFTESENNNNFDQADIVDLPSCLGQGIQISGGISNENDVDVYEISGEFNVGDRIIVDVDDLGNLDSTAGVFDAEGDSLYIYGDLGFFGFILDPYISFILRDYYSKLYVAIAKSRKSDSEIGNYNIVITKNPDNYPGVSSQRFLLDFDGGENVVIDNPLDPIDVPPLEDSPFLSENYPGQINLIKQIIIDEMEEDYADYDVQFYTTDGVLPQEPYSNIYFGAYYEGALGKSQSIDEYNENQNDKAIVYIESFDDFLILNPTVQEISHAIVRTASHEAGHLMGLQHTQDVEEIMDNTASLYQRMTYDQTFKDSPLSFYDVFLIGDQDAPYLLGITTNGYLSCRDTDDVNYPPGRIMPDENSILEGGSVWDNVEGDTKYDYCGSRWNLMEYYCNADTGIRAGRSMGCPEEYECVGYFAGDLCVPINPECIDYDDFDYPTGHSSPTPESIKIGGWYGRTRVTTNTVDYDYCDANDNDYIYESICNIFGTNQYIRTQCPNGYECVEIPKGDLCVPVGTFCDDYDDSENPPTSSDASLKIAGYTVNRYSGETTAYSGFDECVNYANSFYTHVLEYYCDDHGKILEQIVPCPSGTECHGAKCVELNKIDSDDVSHASGEGPTEASMFVGGFIEGEESSFDSCVGNSVMESYYNIDTHQQESKLLECGCGSVCVEGANGAYCSESEGGGCSVILGATEIVEDGDVLFTTNPNNWVVSNTDSLIRIARTITPAYRGYIEWDIRPIPDDAIIEELSFSYSAINEANFFESIGRMDNRPSISSPRQIYESISAGSGSYYYSPQNGFVSSGDNTIVLKDIARSHMQSKVDTDEDWFAVGISASSTSDFVSIMSSESGSATSPKLIVKYNLPAVCGNGIVELGEQCDPPGSSQSCNLPGSPGGGLGDGSQPINYNKLAVTGNSGTQICSASCTWGSCVSNPVCGDNVCNGNETCSSCLGDCGSCGGGGGSFMPGTEITMGDEGKKKIEEVKIGDEVLSYDENNRMNIISKVIGVFNHVMPGYYILDEHLEITATNPIFVNGEWSYPPKLKVGDELLTAEGKEKKIERIEYVEGEVKVYNLQIEKTKNYFAEGILVHNKDDQTGKYEGL